MKASGGSDEEREAERSSRQRNGTTAPPAWEPVPKLVHAWWDLPSPWVPRSKFITHGSAWWYVSSYFGTAWEPAAGRVPNPRARMMFGWCSRESREDSLSKSATATSTFSFSGRSVLTAHGAPSSEQAEATQNSPAPRRFIGPRDAQSTSFEPTGALTSAIVVRQEASDRENEPRVAACSFVAAFCSIGVASGIAEGKPSVTGGRCPDRGEPELSARPEYVNADSLARCHAIESVAAKARSSQKLVGRERSRPAGEDLAEYRPILSASNSSQEEEEDFEGANGGGASDIEHRPGPHTPVKHPPCGRSRKKN